MKPIIIMLLISISLISCTQNKVENILDGWWTMDTIYYKNYDIKACLGNNSLNFKIGGESELPYARNNCEPILIDNYYPKAEVKLLISKKENDTIPLRLKIITKNKLFAGIHKIIFYKDDLNGLLKMEIFSNNLYVVCRKGLFNYDKHIALINELEKLSWRTRPKSKK